MHKGYAEGLIDRQLVAAPFRAKTDKIISSDGNSSQLCLLQSPNDPHEVRQAFKEALNIAPEKIRLIYDVCHNIAKFETYEVEGKLKRLCIHRKGATRAFGPEAEELNPIFKRRDNLSSFPRHGTS
jgi:tRNA-splicing ligase RtcB (3'-phosphate/5'-hydroxy nucleic acid ligase)